MRISVDQFFLDRQSGIGLQAQLREKIAEAILSRRFTPGQRLPSSRKLADHLGIARITASLVYQDLVADGYLNAAPRSGYFVAPDAPGLMASGKDIPAGKDETGKSRQDRQHHNANFNQCDDIHFFRFFI